MYPVSSAYMEAIAQPVRDFKIAVTFKYADGTQVTFDDHDLVTNSDVIIESQAVSGSASCNTIDVGAVPTATASLAILEDDTNLHRYAGAEYNICVSLKLDSGEYEPVEMGTFYVDSSKTSRIGNKIEVFGYDSMPSLMYEIWGIKDELNGMTAYSAVRRLVNVSMVKCKFFQNLSGFPNSNLPLNFDSTQIRTARDAIMWIAQLMGCFARINRYNHLEFVPIKSNWKWYNDEHTSGTILAARTIYGAERYETKFSDDRIHISGISMLRPNGYVETYKRSGLESDSNVIINLEQNPLIVSSETSHNTTMNAILDQLSSTYFYAFRSEIINDPALEAGDTIRLKGGLINGTNQNEDLIGFITHNTWRYRGRQTVVNTGHIAIGYEGAQSPAAIVPTSSQSVKSLQGSIDRNTTPPNWVGESGYIGVKVRDITYQYTETVLNGTTGSMTPVSGNGAELSVRRKDATSYYSIAALTFNAFRVYNSKYTLSLGTPMMQFFDAVHNLGFKWRYKAQTTAEPEDQLELYFGGDASKITIKFDKETKTLKIDGVSKIQVDGYTVFDKKDYQTGGNT